MCWPRSRSQYSLIDIRVVCTEQVSRTLMFWLKFQKDCNHSKVIEDCKDELH